LLNIQFSFIRETKTMSLKIALQLKEVVVPQLWLLYLKTPSSPIIHLSLRKLCSSHHQQRAFRDAQKSTKRLFRNKSAMHKVEEKQGAIEHSMYKLKQATSSFISIMVSPNNVPTAKQSKVIREKKSFLTLDMCP
jgi:hypothetical protein